MESARFSSVAIFLKWFSEVLSAVIWYIFLCEAIFPNSSLDFQVMGSKTKIFIVLEFVTGGELFDKIVSIIPFLRNIRSNFSLLSYEYSF